MRASLLAASAAVAGLAAAMPTDHATGWGTRASQETFANGRISFFTQQGTYGSCGQLHNDDEDVVAISYKLQGSTYPPPYCGRKIRITHQGANVTESGAANDLVVEATVVDTCTTCDDSHLELSVNAWETLTGKPWDEEAQIGRIQWNFI